MNYLFIYGASFLLVLFSIVLLRPIAHRIALVDAPGGRKRHEGNIPVIGGISMFIGFIFLLLMLDFPSFTHKNLIFGATFIVLVGTLDDYYGLSAKARLLSQLFAAFIVTYYGNNSISHLGSILFTHPLQLGLFSIPFTMIAMVALINAINMLDGIDGLAGSIVFVAIFLIALLAKFNNHHFPGNILIGTMVILFAYLLFNLRLPGRRQALIFMGDSGSMLLGFILAWFCIDLTHVPHQAIKPITLLWICAFPAFDIIAVVLWRLYHGRSPLNADREHLHHILKDMGLSANRIVLLMSCFALFLGLLSIIAMKINIPDGDMFFGFIALFAVYARLTIFLRRYADQKKLISYQGQHLKSQALKSQTS